MRGSAVLTKNGIQLDLRGKTVKVGTVIVENVRLNGKVRGNVTEAIDKVVWPYAEVARWNRLRYVCSIGKYVDVETREPVEEARAVYITGQKMYYLPLTV